MAGRAIRTYLDDVPEDVKAALSRTWGDRKSETYAAANRHGIRYSQGDSFNRVLTFELEPGFYHISTGIASIRDIAPSYSDVGNMCEDLINGMAAEERSRKCTPLIASNVCDWDSGYARDVGANVRLRDSVIRACVGNDVVLTGGETANLGDQVRKKGISWMFNLLSRYDGSLTSTRQTDNPMDLALYDTFDRIADRNYEIVYGGGMPLLHIKKRSRFLLTADGTGSKSIVCEQIGKRTDIEDTLAMCCDDAAREGAFPVAATIGIHAENSNGRDQIVDYMIRAGKKHLVPLVGCAYHVSGDINTYTMSGVVLNEVRERTAHIGKEIDPGIALVSLHEEQRSNGITTQRRILSETFGDKWYEVPVLDAFRFLDKRLGGEYSGIEISDRERSLGELVAKPSTPYFRVDSMMPEELAEMIKFRVNISSGGLTGKTRRLLEPFGLGAHYSDPFDMPDLIMLLQMSSRIEGSRGIVPDEVAYYTWGCGQGAVIGTTDPDAVRGYYNSNGIKSKIVGVVTPRPEISISSRCLDSAKNRPHVITHKYTEEPFG